MEVIYEISEVGQVIRVCNGKEWGKDFMPHTGAVQGNCCDCGVCLPKLGVSLVHVECQVQVFPRKREKQRGSIEQGPIKIRAPEQGIKG